MPEALLRGGKAPFVRRASSCMELGKLSFCGSRRSFEQRGHPQCRPLCVVAINFDETHRLLSRRFRRASEVICFEPCCRGFEFGVIARRCGDFFWVILLDLPVGMSSTQRIRVTVRGFLYKTDVSGSYRRIGRSQAFELGICHKTDVWRASSWGRCR